MNANMFRQFQSFMSNPAQYMTQRMGIPAEYANNPNGAIQYLMNNGRLNQNQYNQIQGMARQIQNDPMFQQMMK